MSRKSDFVATLDEAGAHWAGAKPIDYVDSFGNYDEAIRAALDGLAVCDRSDRGLVVAHGEDVVPLLQGVVTSDVFALVEPGSGQVSTAVNAKGRLLCAVRLLHGPDILIMEFDRGLVEGGVVAHFKANVISEDARFEVRSDKTARIGLVGPRAVEVVASLGVFNWPIDELIDDFGTWGSIGDDDAIVWQIRGGFELIVDAEAAARTWKRVFESAPYAVPMGEDVTEALRVDAGVPRWGTELSEKIIPLEAGLSPAISFDKGCYVGQEIIARLDTLGTPAKLLRKLICTEPAAVGDPVTHGGKEVGKVTSVARSPTLDKPIALAFLKRDHNDVGLDVEVGGHPATVAAANG